MAENKKGFLLYANYIGTIKQLPDDVAGRLMKHIFSYVNDENPVTDELLVNVVFEQIKAHLKADLEKYILGKHDKSLSGRIGNLKRWHKDLYDEFVSEKLTLDEAEIISQNRKVSHRDNSPSQTVANIAVIDKVIAIDNVIDSVIEPKELNKEGVLFSDLENPTPPVKVEKIDFEKLKLFFNSNSGALSKVQVLSEKRKKNISTLMKKFSKEDFVKVIDKVKISDFLQGTNNRSWKADFDWILNQTNFIKILEGTYDNKPQNENQNGKLQQQFTSNTKKAANFDPLRAAKAAAAKLEGRSQQMG